AWIPRGGGDLVSFLWPTYAFAARSLRSGHIPLWNPHLYSGAPFAADNQSGLFYPINLIAFFLLPTSSYLTMEWLVFFHFWLAGTAMYVALRMEGVRRAAAVVGAIAYMFSDVFVTHVGNLNIVAVSAYLPLAFAFLRRGLSEANFQRSGNRKTDGPQSAVPRLDVSVGSLKIGSGWCAASGVVLGIAALAGHAQMTLVLVTAVGSYAVWEWLQAPRSGKWHIISLFLITVLVAFGISAISIIPAVELTRYTGRAQLDYAEASRWSLPPAGLVGLLSPLVFGRGPAGFWGPWERVETGYAGTLTLLLAGVALFGIAGNAVSQGSRQARVEAAEPPHHPTTQSSLPLFLALLFLFGLLAALGKYTPVHYLLYRFVPGFGQLRVPARFILLSDFALAYLAALGLNRLSSVTYSRTRLFALAGLLAVIGALTLPLAYLGVTRPAPDADTPAHRTALAWGLILYLGMLAVGTLVLDRWLRPQPLTPNRLRHIVAPLIVTALLALDLILAGANAEIEPNDPTRGFRHPLAAQFLLSQPQPTRIDVATGQWQPAAAAMLGLDDIGGISNPLALAHYDAYYWSVGHRGSPQYNFLGAQFVVADKGVPPADATFVPVYNEDPDVDIYLNTNAMPRVNLIYQTRIVPDSRAAFDLVHAPGFDPAREVVVENAPPLHASPPANQASLSYLEYSAEHLTIQVQTPAPAYLAFAEVWYPGWRATVDGRSTPIYRANYAFRAVRLEAGEHRVEMIFDPLTWKIGAGITMLTILRLAAWAWQIIRRAKS
ncbi:MAG: YfhO family protein, partial [Chloroflexi bacterium]|nr:YfhO family protein [Chloroflexota bacterium]